MKVMVLVVPGDVVDSTVKFTLTSAQPMEGIVDLKRQSKH